MDLEFCQVKMFRQRQIGVPEFIWKKTRPNNSRICGQNISDFNRAGVPLVEIVSEPDMASSAEAKLLPGITNDFSLFDVSDADMEKGHMRCEVNISVQEEANLQMIMALSNLWLATR